MFNRMISLFEKHGFLKREVLTKLKIDQLSIGPTGFLLLQILKNEWFYNIVINKDISIFFSDNGPFQDTFQFGKSMCLERLPFGVAEVVTTRKTSGEFLEYVNERMKRDDIDFGEMFDNKEKTSLKCTIFTSARDSVQFFHQWQRQRRIWWRKCSPNPGRYRMSDIKIESDSTQSVQIIAEYPWKSQVIEKMIMHPKPLDINESERFKDGKKMVGCHSVVSHVDLNTMFLNTLCDAYDEPDYKGIKRTLMRFHRKLAPYSISFAIASSGLTATVTSDLKDLALYLTRQLRTKHISTLLLPSSSTLTLDAQWRQYDELGIPYNILLNEKTLKDGIALLRSRETTLKEQVHVTELVTYVEQLFMNY